MDFLRFELDAHITVVVVALICVLPISMDRRLV